MKTESKPFIDFAAVKAAVTITQILEHYNVTGLKQSGDNLRGCCPIHNGRKPKEFSVSVSKNCWNCFTDCGRGGNIFDFVALTEEVSIHEAALLINDWFELELVRNPESKASRVRKSETARSKQESKGSGRASTREPSTNSPLGFELKNLDTEHPYLDERGISSEAVAEFGLGYCSKGSMAGRIVIPIKNKNSQLLGYLGRWPGEPPKDCPKYKFPKDFSKSLELFNIYRAAKCPAEMPLVIVEGVFDVISLWQRGFFKCVAIMGSSLSEAQEALIKQLTSKIDPIVILLDEDDAGRKGRVDALHRLAMHTYVHVASLPEEGQQPENLNDHELTSLLA